MDTALDAAALVIASRLASRRIRPLRLLLGALTGAGTAFLTRRLMLSRAQTACLWLPTALAMAIAAQGRRALRQPLRHVGLLLCAQGLLGGTMTALHGATGSLAAAYLLGGLGVTGMTAALARAGRAAQDVLRVEVICRHGGCIARFEAMIDSGNTLRDYLTHRPVIVMPMALGKRLFDVRDGPLRPIFADTAGGRQMMALLVPQETAIVTRGREVRVAAAVAFSEALSGDAPALAPASLLNGMQDIKA